jgi:hypothetical protein
LLPGISEKCVACVLRAEERLLHEDGGCSSKISEYTYHIAEDINILSFISSSKIDKIVLDRTEWVSLAVLLFHFSLFQIQ